MDNNNCTKTTLISICPLIFCSTSFPSLCVVSFFPSSSFIVSLYLSISLCLADFSYLRSQFLPSFDHSMVLQSFPPCLYHHLSCPLRLSMLYFLLFLIASTSFLPVFPFPSFTKTPSCLSNQDPELPAHANGTKATSDSAWGSPRADGYSDNVRKKKCSIKCSITSHTPLLSRSVNSANDLPALDPPHPIKTEITKHCTARTQQPLPLDMPCVPPVPPLFLKPVPAFNTIQGTRGTRSGV